MEEVIACGIPQGAGQKQRNTAGNRTEQNGGIPPRAGQKAAEYRREQDRNSGIPQATGLEKAEYRGEQD